MGDNRYLYPVSRTKSLELKLLDSNVLERLVSCQNSDEAFKILGETSYSEYLLSLTNPLDVEGLIKMMMLGTKSYLTEISPDAALMGFLYHSEDIQNLKRILKAYYMKSQHINIDVEPFSPLGCLPIKEMKNALSEGDYRLFPELWIPVIKSLYEGISKDGFLPVRIDQKLDQLLFEDLHQSAVNCKSDYMISLVQTQSDLENLMILFRMKHLKDDSDAFEQSFLPHGLIEKGLLKAAMDEPLSQLPDKLIRFGYDGLIRKALELPDPISQMIRFEKHAHDYYFERVKRSKFIAFGVEPLVGYGLAKAYETKWLRLILMGKIHGLSEVLIRERLGEVYV